MSVRESLSKNPRVAVAGAALLIVAAAALMAHALWPQKQSRADMAYYSDDDGQTWFADSVYRIPPFDHNGKPALQAAIFTYDDGKKSFCAYLQQYTQSARQQLQKAQADATAHGQPLNSIWQYRDHNFVANNTQVRLPGPGHPWVLLSDPHSNDILTIHAPDGSAVDQALVY